jgi:hypothetical protein
MRLLEPATQLAQSSVRTRGYVGADRVVEAERFWQHVTSPRTRRGLPVSGRRLSAFKT